MAKKFSLNVTKIWAKVNSDRLISKNLVSWPLDGALAHESKNNFKGREKMRGRPWPVYFIFDFER